MTRNIHIRPGSFTTKVLVMAVIICFGQYVFAVDGLIDGGKKSTKAFSTIKSDLSISLKNGYNFHNYKTMGTRRSQNMVMSNSILTFQKGNVTWVVPQRNKTKILQKFKTPGK
ncbi:MAG TPA: hypothetical protein VK166_20025 [Chitinophagaceae bacterium]|nr:hypothetical protein [Chitinophagaceae bacterium]